MQDINGIDNGQVVYTPWKGEVKGSNPFIPTNGVNSVFGSTTDCESVR